MWVAGEEMENMEKKKYVSSFKVSLGIYILAYIVFPRKLESSSACQGILN
jgi:hypothetical protein